MGQVAIKIDRLAVIMEDVIGHTDGDPFATNESIEARAYNLTVSG